MGLYEDLAAVEKGVEQPNKSGTVKTSTKGNKSVLLPEEGGTMQTTERPWVNKNWETFKGKVPDKNSVYVTPSISINDDKSIYTALAKVDTADEVPEDIYTQLAIVSGDKFDITVGKSKQAKKKEGLGLLDKALDFVTPKEKSVDLQLKSGVHDKELSWRQGSEKDWVSRISKDTDELKSDVQKELPLLDEKRTMLQDKGLYSIITDPAGLIPNLNNNKDVSDYNNLLSSVKNKSNRVIKFETSKKKPQLIQQATRALGIDKLTGTDEATVEKIINNRENALAAMEYNNIKREKNDTLELLLNTYTNAAAFGLPKAILESQGYGIRKPEGFGEQTATGFAELGGFITGGPGSVSKLVTKGVEKYFPKLIYTGTENFLTRSAIQGVKEVPSLTAAMASSSIGNALTQTNLDDAFNIIKESSIGGAEMGGVFAGSKAAFPSSSALAKIKRIAIGTALLDASRGTRPWDERELQQKIVDYGIDTFFLWHGMSEKDLIKSLVKLDADIEPIIERSLGKALREALRTADDATKAKIYEEALNKFVFAERAKTGEPSGEPIRASGADEQASIPLDRRPVAVSEPFKPGETPEPYTHKSDEVAPTGSAQAPKVTPDSPAKFMVREELKKKLADGSIKFPPRMEKTVEATTSAEGDIDESGWMDFVDEAAGIKKETTIPAVFKTMHMDDLKEFANNGVVGARAEIAKRKVANTTEPIIESEMSKSDIQSDEPTKKEVTKALTPSNYSPTDNIFNKPELKRNSTYAWRSMGESEFNKLMSGEKEYLGDKQASKGNFLAGIPESAGQFGGKGKYLVEFGGVKIAGDEGLAKGSKATVNNITKVWKYNDKVSKWEEFPVSRGTSGSFSVANPVFSKATSERSSSKKGEVESHKKKVVNKKKEDKKKLGEETEKSTSSALQALESKAKEPKKKITAKGILGNESGAVVASYPPGFYSKLQEVVEVKMSGKMEVDQLKKMLKNNGVSDAEIDSTLLGLEGKVTKQQVMEEIASNGIEFKDVVLGKTDKKYQDVLNAEVSRANRFLQAQDTDIRKRASEIAAGDPHDLIAFASHVANNSSYMPVGTYKASEDFINIEDAELPTHYEQYTEPGYVPGSYRELFVTIPRKVLTADQMQSMTNEEVKTLYDKQNPTEWQDGHSAYSNIDNPIVRIRFNERKIDNKKVLFVEEMQGPSSDNQTRMPDALQKRIYDIGVKKVLSYAKENGFDSVAWTSGDMQVDRYDLSRQIKQIDYAKNEDGTYKVAIIDKAGIEIDQLSKYDYTTQELENLIGKDIVKKMINSEGRKNKIDDEVFYNLSGLDLKVGGEGLKQLYDKILPSMFKKYGKNEIDKLSLDVEDDFKNWKALYDPIEKEWVVENSDGKIMELVADKGQTAADAVDTALKSRGRYHKDGIVLSTPINSKTPSSFTMYSGINVFDTLDVLRGLKENIKEGIPYIEELGRKAYENGKRTWEDWSREIKRVLGDLYDKFEDFMKAIYYTAERMWKDDRGVIGFDINGEKVVKPRIIRRSELSKLKRVISKHEKIREKIQDEVNELEGIGGKKSFERLKAIRLEKMEARLAKLKQERAINRAEMWSKAFEMLKEKEYASHIAKLKTSINRLDKTIDRLKGLADRTKDRTDVKAPKVSLEDAEFITSMPDLKGKWLGRIFENPIYTMEEWGRAFNKIASGEAKDGVTKIKELFYYPLRDAAHRADQHFANIHAQIEARRKNLPKGASKRIMLYAYSKEKGGMDILKEMGYTEKDIPKLTEAEMSTLNWMYKGFEIFYDKINAARREAGMEQFGKVENYFTFGKDLSIAEILGFGIDDPRLMEFVHPKGTTFMSAKHRFGGMKRASLDAFNIFDMYMQTGTKHMYLSPEIARMRELLRKFDIENLNSDGSKYTTEWKASEQIPRAYSVLTDYLDFVAGKRKKLFPSSVEKGIQFLSTNITMATLSGNIRSAGIQPTAIHNTYVEIGPKYTAKGLEGLFTDMRYKAMQKSMVLFNREFDVSVKPTMSGAVGAIGKAREKINKSWIGMRALKELDMQTATATWIGAYKKALEFDKMTEKEAVRYADDVVIKTQASAGRHDLAPIQRTAIGKFFTTFQTFVINNWNWLMKEVVGLKNESISNKKAVHKVVRYIIGAMLINTFYEDLLGVNSPLPAPIKAAHKAYIKAEEKNKKARSEETMVNPYSRAAWSAGLEFLQLVPGLGNARFGSSFLGAPAEYLSDVSGKVAAESGVYTGYEKPWLEILGKTVGLPGTTQLSKTIRYFDKKEKEEEKERKGGGKLKGLEGMKGLEGLD